MTLEEQLLEAVGLVERVTSQGASMLQLASIVDALNRPGHVRVNFTVAQMARHGKLKCEVIAGQVGYSHTRYRLPG